MFRIGGDSKFLLVCAADAMKSAQTLDAIQPSLLALRELLASNLLGAVDATATLMSGLDSNNQMQVFEFAR